MKTIIATALLAAAAQATRPLSAEDFSFVQFIAKNGKHYRSTEEYQKRFRNFKHAYTFVQKHNANPDKTASVGINYFADWSQ